MGTVRGRSSMGGRKLAILVPGGVHPSGERAVIPRLLGLVERLSRRHEVHVFSRAPFRPFRYVLQGAQIHAPAGRPRSAALFQAALRENARRPFDLVHSMWAALAPLGAALARALGVPHVAELTGGDLANLPELRYGARAHLASRLWSSLATRSADAVIVPSQEMLAVSATLGIDAIRIPHAVALDRWPIAAPRRRPLSSRLRLLQIGSVNRVKDHATSLRALRRLQGLGLDAGLDIVGEDCLGGAVAAQARTLGLGEAVRFHGFMPQAALRPLMLKAHVLLVSSRHEGDPVAALEAAASGVPTVGTAVGHLREWAPLAALAVPCGDDDALSLAISRVASDEDLRLRLASEAQAIAARFDADWAASAIESLHEAVLSDRPAPRGGPIPC